MLPGWSFFNNMEEIRDYLHKVDTEDYTKADARWIFWNNSIFDRKLKG
jgi:hypothetical protein